MPRPSFQKSPGKYKLMKIKNITVLFFIAFLGCQKPDFGDKQPILDLTIFPEKITRRSIGPFFPRNLKNLADVEILLAENEEFSLENTNKKFTEINRYQRKFIKIRWKEKKLKKTSLHCLAECVFLGVQIGDPVKKLKKILMQKQSGKKMRLRKVKKNIFRSGNLVVHTRTGVIDRYILY